MFHVGVSDFSLENFNTDDVEALIGGQARPGARDGLPRQLSQFAPPIPNPLATLMSPIVFSSGMKTAPGGFSGARFTW